MCQISRDRAVDLSQQVDGCRVRPTSFNPSQWGEAACRGVLFRAGQKYGKVTSLSFSFSPQKRFFAVAFLYARQRHLCSLALLISFFSDSICITAAPHMPSLSRVQIMVGSMLRSLLPPCHFNPRRLADPHRVAGAAAHAGWRRGSFGRLDPFDRLGTQRRTGGAHDDVATAVEADAFLTRSPPPSGGAPSTGKTSVLLCGEGDFSFARALASSVCDANLSITVGLCTSMEFDPHIE